MELYLVRHAPAAPRGVTFHSDADRPLTEAGAKKMRRHVRALRHMRVHLDVVLASPCLRARQTADIVAAGINPSPRLETCTDLAPDGALDGVIAQLARQPLSSAVALVGHNPDLSHLASTLLWNTPDVDIDFKKGGVCRIDVTRLSPPFESRLRWLMTGQQLRSIAKARGKGK